MVNNFRRLFDSNALWISMVIGAVGYSIFLPLKPILPWLIFFMLFFTFCKVNPLDLRLHKWHWLVLGIQIFLALATYVLIFLWTENRVLAQGLMLCFIMPTATAAPIIAGKLGGSIQNLTAFTLLSNFATSIIVPLFFPIVQPGVEKAFMPAFLRILSHVAPLLLVPFASAWVLRLAYKWKTKKEFVLSARAAQIPFYLWVASIVVLTAVVTQTVIDNINTCLMSMVYLLIGSFFICLMQFGLGKFIGYRLPAASKGTDYQDVLINPAAAPKTMAGVSSITAGQAFGQKNTSLGVWMAQTYLDPLSALGAAAYIIWQNVFNWAQLNRAAHGKSV